MKKASDGIVYTMSKEYQSLVKQFVKFREKTWGIIDVMSDYSDRMLTAETVLAQTYPIYE